MTDRIKCHVNLPVQCVCMTCHPRFDSTRRVKVCNACSFITAAPGGKQREAVIKLCDALDSQALVLVTPLAAVHDVQRIQLCASALCLSTTPPSTSRCSVRGTESLAATMHTPLLWTKMHTALLRTQIYQDLRVNRVLSQSFQSNSLRSDKSIIEFKEPKAWLATPRAPYKPHPAPLPWRGGRGEGVLSPTNHRNPMNSMDESKRKRCARYWHAVWTGVSRRGAHVWVVSAPMPPVNT